MFDTHAYLRAEIKRYFPDAIKVDVMDVDEVITLTVHWSDNYLEYRMEVGSDDNWFSFFNDEMQSTITIPFAPKMSA